MADGRSMHDYRIVVVGPGGVGFAFYPPPRATDIKDESEGRGGTERTKGAAADGFTR